MIVMILIGASIFGYFFTLTHVTRDLVAWVGALPTSRWVIIVLSLCGYVVLGSFMDQLAILVLTVPIVIPLIKTLGFDPIWFGVIKIVTAEVGMITPPLGLNCFIVVRYANRPVAEVFHGTFPHFHRASDRNCDPRRIPKHYPVAAVAHGKLRRRKLMRRPEAAAASLRGDVIPRFEPVSRPPGLHERALFICVPVPSFQRSLSTIGILSLLSRLDQW